MNIISNMEIIKEHEEKQLNIENTLLNYETDQQTKQNIYKCIENHDEHETTSKKHRKTSRNITHIGKHRKI